jgi:hypothetical protein
MANSHTLHFTTASTISSQSAVSWPVVAWYWLPTPQLPQLPCSSPYWPATVSQLTPTLLTAVSRLSRNRRCFLLHSLGTDRIENIFPNSSYIVASRGYRSGRIGNTVPLFLLPALPSKRHCLQNHYLATGLHAAILLLYAVICCWRVFIFWNGE